MTEPYEAWLCKQAGRRWKKRWFVLDEAVLTLYSSEKKSMSLGTTKLNSGTVELIADDAYFAFEVKPASGKTSRFATSDSAEREAWLEALVKHGVSLGATVTDPSLRPADPSGDGAASGAGAGSAAPPAPIVTTAPAAEEAAPEPVAASRTPIASDNPEFMSLVASYMSPSAENLAKLFDVLDSSGDGNISVSEWCSAIRKSKVGARELKRNLGKQLALFNSIDADGSGDVDKEEFVAGLTGTSDESLLHWMAASLAALEVDPCKPAPSEDATKVATESAEDLEVKREQLIRLYSIIDVNGDGDITVSELLSSFRKCTDSEPLSSSLDHQLRLFASMDSDGSGGLDQDEFVGAALHINDSAFSDWVDRVLYEDKVAQNAEKLAAADSAAASAAAEALKTRSSVKAGANPLFSSSAPGTPTASSAPGTPTSGGGNRAHMLLGRVAGKTRGALAGGRRRRGRGGKK